MKTAPDPLPPSPSSPASEDFDRQAVIQQLKKILSSDVFRNSPQLIGFLHFVVHQTLAGESAQLKEYVIGVEVFDRKADFSPREDPVVRVAAGRLRSKLAEYYQRLGQSDRVVIDLPKGGYTPKWNFHPKLMDPQPYSRLQPVVPAPSDWRATAVGRHEELRRLRTALMTVSLGRGIALTVCGDAGIGKTTIVQVFLSELERGREPIWIGRGRCSERLADTEPFVPILESLDELLRTNSDVADLMKTAAPTWFTQVAPAQHESTGTPAASHERMRREFVAFLDQLSRSRTVVLFFDDMHWADPSTCDLLGYLGGRMRDCRILMLITYRPGPIMAQRHPFLPLKLDLECRGISEDVPLSLLTRGDIEQYLALRFPQNRFPDSFATVVHERTEGHPLFMSDMFGFLQDSGILANRNGEWIAEKPAQDLRQLIPSGVRNMVRLKIDQISEDDRQILICAAVQGTQFDSEVVARVLDRHASVVEERLQDLATIHKFILNIGDHEFPNGSLSVRYRFLHVFYQNVLYDSLVPARRAEHSRNMARVLLELSGNQARARAAELALLFETGRDSAGAAQYLLYASRNAARVFAYPEAVALCERGLTAVEKLPPSVPRDTLELQFLLTLGISLMASRGYAAAEVENVQNRARELCIRLNERKRLMSVLWGLHTCHVNSGSLMASLSVAREMRNLAESSQDLLARVESLHALGTSLAFLGRTVEACETLESIFASDPSGRHAFQGALYVMDPWVTSLSMLGRLLTLMGKFDQAIDRLTKSIELARALTHPPSLAYATFWVGWFYQTIGTPEKGIGHLEDAIALSLEYRLPQILEWGRLLRGAALVRMGRTADGIAAMRASIEAQTAMRSLVERSYCLTLLADALCRNGAPAESLALCDEALEFAQRTEGRCYESETHRVRAEALWALRDPVRPDEAQAEFEISIEVAAGRDSRLLELRAALSCFRHLKTDRARGSLARVLEKFKVAMDIPELTQATEALQFQVPTVSAVSHL